jgi:cytochrome P450
VVQDRRDFAAFYMNLSRTGGEVVPYRVGGRSAFLVNRPEHARRVLVTNQANYRNPAHPYADLAAFYRPPGLFMLRLNRQPEGRDAALARGADELVTVATEAADELIEQSAAAPASVDLAVKRMMFRVITRTHFGVDPRHLSEAFVHAVTLIEECWANQGFGDGPGDDALGRLCQQAIATQDSVAAWIARRAAMVPAGEPVPPELITMIVRTLLNSYNATATALCWLIHEISRDARLLARLHEEVDRVVGTRRPAYADVPRLNYARMVAMEVLRLYPPAWIIGRRTIGPDRLGGTSIPPARSSRSPPTRCSGWLSYGTARAISSRNALRRTAQRAGRRSPISRSAAARVAARPVTMPSANCNWRSRRSSAAARSRRPDRSRSGSVALSRYARIRASGHALLPGMAGAFRSRASLEAEIAMLRHQLDVLRRIRGLDIVAWKTVS